MTAPMASFASQTFTPDRLMAGDLPPLTKPTTLITGQNLPRGAVLGKITASGKYTLSTSAASDGSQIPDAILVQNTDATAADVNTVAFIRGDFDGASLTLGAGHTLASIIDGLRQRGIFLITSQGA